MFAKNFGPLMEPLVVTNRKGSRYYLCRVSTARGGTRYVFSRTPRGELMSHVPEGYVVTESINGVLSLSRPQEQQITGEERAFVERRIPRRLPLFPVEVKGKRIIVHEWMGNGYTPLVRFTLRDEVERLFTVERFVHRGEGYWYDLDEGPLQRIAGPVLSKLGSEAFYEML